MKYVKFIWALPVTLIGCFLLALSCGWTRADRVSGCLMWGFVPRFDWWFPARFSASTLGNIIIVRKYPLPPATMLEEIEHSRQCGVLGGFIIVYYLVGGLLALALYRDWYAFNWFEIMAKRVASGK